jgi:hypothetical protein
LADRAYLASQGARLLLAGRAPFGAAVRAMYHALKALRDGTPPETPAEARESADLLARLTDQPGYERDQAAYLGGAMA